MDICHLFLFTVLYTEVHIKMLLTDTCRYLHNSTGEKGLSVALWIFNPA